MEDLGAMGGTSSIATDITDNGQICGMAIKAGGVQTAFIYGVGAAGMHELNNLVSAADPLKSHVNLTFAQQVNEFGQILATGVDTSINRNRLYLLSPVDATKPVISSIVTGTKGANGWYTSNVSITWAVTDDEAPIGSSSGCGAATVSTDTTGKKFTCKAASMGGIATKSVTVKRDSVKPTATNCAAGSRCCLQQKSVGDGQLQLYRCDSGHSVLRRHDCERSQDRYVEENHQRELHREGNRQGRPHEIVDEHVFGQ